MSVAASADHRHLQRTDDFPLSQRVWLIEDRYRRIQGRRNTLGRLHDLVWDITRRSSIVHVQAGVERTTCAESVLSSRVRDPLARFNPNLPTVVLDDTYRKVDHDFQIFRMYRSTPYLTLTKLWFGEIAYLQHSIDPPKRVQSRSGTKIIRFRALRTYFSNMGTQRNQPLLKMKAACRGWRLRLISICDCLYCLFNSCSVQCATQYCYCSWIKPDDISLPTVIEPNLRDCVACRVEFGRQSTRQPHSSFRNKSRI